MDLDEVAAAFEGHRRLLTGIAYRILGSWTEAEDLIQDVWPRWETNAADVESPQAWLRRVTVRAAIDRLRRLRRLQRRYTACPGPRLPEPVATLPDPAQVVEDRDSVSAGMLLVIETLSPLERAVFVLRQGFDWSYEEIGDILGRSATAVRQLDHRARRHVADRRPRYEADENTARASAEAFRQACLNGDVAGLLALLAPDVALHSDAGGEAPAPRRPSREARKTASFLTPIDTTPLSGTAILITHVNAHPAIAVTGPQAAAPTMCLDVDDQSRFTAPPPRGRPLEAEPRHPPGGPTRPESPAVGPPPDRRPAVDRLPSVARAPPRPGCRNATLPPPRPAPPAPWEPTRMRWIRARVGR